MAFIEWWNSLELASQVFYCIAIPATLILLIQTVLMFFGFENDADGDLDMDLPDTDMDVDLSDADIDGGIFGEDAITETPDLAGLESLHIFTVRGIIAFGYFRLGGCCSAGGRAKSVHHLAHRRNLRFCHDVYHRLFVPFCHEITQQRNCRQSQRGGCRRQGAPHHPPFPHRRRKGPCYASGRLRGTKCGYR